MQELRIRFGDDEWGSTLSVEELEKRINSGDEFVEIPMMGITDPPLVIKVRPKFIEYYFVRK